MKLLTRDEFRRLTLRRNNGICVVPECDQTATDAHHILNRRLFTQPHEQGGYFYNNGAGLCAEHHLQAERTVISADELYRWCEIDQRALPEQFDAHRRYDTWGNEVINEYSRARGPLFDDEGCQKALKKGAVIWQFGYQN